MKPTDLEKICDYKYPKIDTIAKVTISFIIQSKIMFNVKGQVTNNYNRRTGEIQDCPDKLNV